MDVSEPAESELTTLPSAHGVAAMVERLKSLLERKSVQLFADIDHAAAAEAVGLALRPTRVLIFGSPRAGTPLMQSSQTIGLDLPLRVLVWEDADGKPWLTYRRPSVLARQHGVAGQDEGVRLLDEALAVLAGAATAP